MINPPAQPVKIPGFVFAIVVAALVCLANILSSDIVAKLFNIGHIPHWLFIFSAFLYMLMMYRLGQYLKALEMKNGWDMTAVLIVMQAMLLFLNLATYLFTPSSALLSLALISNIIAFFNGLLLVLFGILLIRFDNDRPSGLKPVGIASLMMSFSFFLYLINLFYTHYRSGGNGDETFSVIVSFIFDFCSVALPAAIFYAFVRAYMRSRN